MEAMNCEPISPTPTGFKRLLSDIVVSLQGAQCGADHACLGSERGSAHAQTMRVRPPRIAPERCAKGLPISPRRATQASSKNYECGIQRVRHDRHMNGELRRSGIDDVAGDSWCRESRPAYGDRVGFLQTESVRPTHDAWPGGALLECFTINSAI